MRRILVALLLLVLGAPALARHPAPSVQREIEQAMTQSAAGWNAGDVQRFMAVYSTGPQTSFVVKDGLIRGKPAMIARYREKYDFSDPAKRGTLTFETLDFRRLGPGPCAVHRTLPADLSRRQDGEWANHIGVRA